MIPIECGNSRRKTMVSKGVFSINGGWDYWPWLNLLLTIDHYQRVLTTINHYEPWLYIYITQPCRGPEARYPATTSRAQGSRAGHKESISWVFMDFAWCYAPWKKKEIMDRSYTCLFKKHMYIEYIYIYIYVYIYICMDNTSMARIMGIYTYICTQLSTNSRTFPWLKNPNLPIQT